ncbi:MAG: hypothetical protein RL491_161 [Bacteroidota bacterium]
MKIKGYLMLLFLAMFGTAAMAQESKITIKTTARCGECKENIEKALMQEKGVRFAELDVKTAVAVVVYNSKKTTPETLRKAISDVGYDADELAANPVAVEKLKPCCKKDAPCMDAGKE